MTTATATLQLSDIAGGIFTALGKGKALMCPTTRSLPTQEIHALLGCRPLIVVGKGAAQSHADSLIRQLVDKVQIPVLSTSMGRGVVPDDHPLSVIAARSLALSKADVVLVIGARYPHAATCLFACWVGLHSFAQVAIERNQSHSVSAMPFTQIWWLCLLDCHAAVNPPGCCFIATKIVGLEQSVEL